MTDEIKIVVIDGYVAAGASVMFQESVDLALAKHRADIERAHEIEMLAALGIDVGALERKLEPFSTDMLRDVRRMAEGLSPSRKFDLLFPTTPPKFEREVQEEKPKGFRRSELLAVIGERPKRGRRKHR